MKKSFFYIYLVLITSFGVVHAQQFYRWVDAKGNVHYTQYSPDESRIQAVNLDPTKPQQVTSTDDLRSLDVFQSSTAHLIEIPQRQRFNPKDRESLASNVKIVAEALDPKSMDYCQTIQVNLNAFGASEKGEFDQLYIISQSGERSKLSPEEERAKYKATIDNLEKYCL